MLTDNPTPVGSGRFRSVPRPFPGFLLGPGNILFVFLPGVAQRDAPFKENGWRSYIVACMGSATPAELLQGHQEASDVTRITCEAHGMRNEMVRRISGGKGVYRKVSGLLENPVHTRLIPANWLEFRKEGGSGACRGQRQRRRKSSIL
jgi:hypothetical protein